MIMLLCNEPHLPTCPLDCFLMFDTKTVLIIVGWLFEIAVSSRRPEILRSVASWLQPSMTVGPELSRLTLLSFKRGKKLLGHVGYIEHSLFI